MGVYFGQSGEIALKRDSLQEALKTKLDPFDVNTSKKRFSVDFADGSLLTGDQIEIETVDGSTLELINGHNFPDAKAYIHVDQAGGIRLYNTFGKALSGEQSDALTLVTPSAAKNVLIKTRNERFRQLANVTDFEMTTSRDQVDTTNLGDQFRNQYEAGLISGQGTLNAFFEHRYEHGYKQNERGVEPEFPFYLAQLVLRTQQGSDFDGAFYLYKDNANSKKDVFYECNCIVTNVAINVTPSEVIETSIEFVTNGIIKLKTGGVPGFLLQENTDKILQENQSPILLDSD